MQRKFSGAKVSIWSYGELALHCGASAEWANRQSNPYRIVPGPHGSAERKRRKTFSFLSVGLPNPSSPRLCCTVKRVRLRYGSGVTDPKAFGSGGKGIRTPGLLLANETLYQLSYTPRSSFGARD